MGRGSPGGDLSFALLALEVPAGRQASDGLRGGTGATCPAPASGEPWAGLLTSASSPRALGAGPARRAPFLVDRAVGDRSASARSSRAREGGRLLRVFLCQGSVRKRTSWCRNKNSLNTGQVGGWGGRPAACEAPGPSQVGPALRLWSGPRLCPVACPGSSLAPWEAEAG